MPPIEIILINAASIVGFLYTKCITKVYTNFNKKYKIVIFTCKANPKRPLIKGKTGPELIWEWLEKYDLKSCVKDVTYDKINALYYIDDKAISFNNWDSTLKHL